MAIVKINELIINLDKNAESYVLGPSSNFVIKIESDDYEIYNKILFMGFPNNDNNSISNIILSEILDIKYRLKSNNATCFLYRILEEIHKYDYFILFPAGLDPAGINFLKKLPRLFKEIDKKIYVVDQVSFSKHFDF
jgi:hypothetical protein